MHATETSLHGEQQWPEISTHTEKRESSEIDFSSSKRHDLFAVLPDGAKEGLSLLSQPPLMLCWAESFLDPTHTLGLLLFAAPQRLEGIGLSRGDFFPPPIQQAQHTGIEGPYSWKGEGSTSAAGSRITSVSHRSWVCREMEAQARKHLVEGGNSLVGLCLLGCWENGGMGSGDSPPAVPMEQSSVSPALLQLWCGLEDGFKHSLPISACVFSQ